MMFGDGFYGFGHGFGGIFMILFWCIIIFLIVRGTNYWTSKGGNENQKQSAEEILKERYARGDISKEDFEQMKKDLHI